VAEERPNTRGQRPVHEPTILVFLSALSAWCMAAPKWWTRSSVDLRLLVFASSAALLGNPRSAPLQHALSRGRVPKAVFADINETAGPETVERICSAFGHIFLLAYECDTTNGAAIKFPEFVGGLQPARLLTNLRAANTFVLGRQTFLNRATTEFNNVEMSQGRKKK